MTNDTAQAITDLDTYMRDLTDDEARTIREVAERVKARGEGYSFTVRHGFALHKLDLMGCEGQVLIEMADPRAEAPDGALMYIGGETDGYLTTPGVQRLRAICDLYLAGRFDEAAKIGGVAESCDAVVNDGACDCAASAAPTGCHDYAATLALDGLPLPRISRENAMYLEADQAETIGRALLACAAKKREG